MYIGIISALSGSFFWTLSSFIWRDHSKSISPILINFIKTSLAAILFAPFLFSQDIVSQNNFILLLIFSGFIGIFLGDTCYLNSLKYIGTRRTLSVEATSPLLSHLIGVIFLNEVITFKLLLGAFLVTISLLFVAFKRYDKSDDTYIDHQILKLKGFIFAILSVLFATLASLISRFVLLSSDLNPFQTTEIRLLSASIFLLLFLCFQPQKISIYKFSSLYKFNILIATVLGTNLGILLQQVTFKFLPLGLGWTLLSTTPVFSLFLSRYEGEKLRTSAILASIMTVLGVCIALT